MAAIALLAPTLAPAQSLDPSPSSPTATRQSTTLAAPPAPKSASASFGSDDRPQPAQSAPRATGVPSSLGERPPSSSSKATKAAPASAKGSADAANARRPVKLYDRGGRLVPGAVQVGPNRVLDTRSGRYYSTVPSGDGQRINE